jgi:polyhydroxyalkanoate synthesis regulator phasin
MNKEYFKLAQDIWEKDVPQNGQSKTIQGELIRSIEKLREEAQRNGNANYDEGHSMMLEYVSDILIDNKVFSDKQNTKIKEIISELEKKDQITIKDRYYDFLTERVVDWYLENTDDNFRKENPNLKR